MSTPEKSILRLTLKRRWFDMIASGKKKEEYRALKPWILSRLDGRKYTHVQFRNGYGKAAPMVEVEYKGWGRGHGRAEWGGSGDVAAIIFLGAVTKGGSEA